eukprot:SAG22_NODE_261_length_13373_cov_17.745472_17_plen_228_part_00
MLDCPLAPEVRRSRRRLASLGRQLGHHHDDRAPVATAATAAATAAEAHRHRLVLTSAVTPGPLTRAQRQSYERDGFLIVDGIFDPAELAPLHAHYIEICRDPATFVKGPAATCASLVRDINVVDGTHSLGVLPPEFGVIKLNGFAGRGGEDELYCGYARHERLLPYVQQFVGGTSLDTFSEMYVCKPPGLDAHTRSAIQPPIWTACALTLEVCSRPASCRIVHEHWS